MAIVKKDFAALTAGLERLLRERLQGYIGDSAGVLDAQVRKAAEHMSVAVQRGRKDLVEEAKDTLETAILERKLAAKAGMANALQDFLAVGVGYIVDGAIAGLSGVKIAQ